MLKPFIRVKIELNFINMYFWSNYYIRRCAVNYFSQLNSHSYSEHISRYVQCCYFNYDSFSLWIRLIQNFVQNAFRNGYSKFQCTNHHRANQVLRLARRIVRSKIFFFSLCVLCSKNNWLQIFSEFFFQMMLIKWIQRISFTTLIRIECCLL